MVMLKTLVKLSRYVVRHFATLCAVIKHNYVALLYSYLVLAVFEHLSSRTSWHSLKLVALTLSLDEISVQRLQVFQ